MSRSLGGTCVTSRSPISTRPLSTGSSPASIRSAVVLPEPDGPTSTMNSPSWTSRSSASTAGGAPLLNTRVADTYFTLAIGDLRCMRGRLRAGDERRPAAALSLDRSHRQAADQRALGYPADDDDGNRGDRRRRAQVRDEQALLRDRADKEHGQRRGVRDRQVDGEKQLVPREDHANERGRGQPRRDNRQDHA